MTTCFERLPQQATRVLILHNPTAGARSGRTLIGQFAGKLQSHQFTVDLLEHPDALASAMAEPQPHSSLRAVVAAGGDGTIATVANCCPPGTPLLVCPLGTENLLAKYLRIQADADQLVDIILGGMAAYLDAAQANGRLFLLMAGCGFDAHVVARLHADRQGHISHWSYVKPIWNTIRSYEYPALRIYCRPEPEQQVDRDVPHEQLWPGACVLPSQPWATARWVFVINVPRYGGGLQFVPQAHPTIASDGLLDVCVFRHGGFLSGLRYLAAVMRGTHLRLPDVQMCRTRAVRVESDSAVPYQLDGDPGGRLPLEITVLPKRLKLLVPDAWARQQQN